jgi:hypothetical protein
MDDEQVLLKVKRDDLQLQAAVVHADPDQPVRGVLVADP